MSNANNKQIEKAQPNAALAKPKSEAPQLRDYLQSDAVQLRLKEVASKYMKAEEITRLFLIASSRNPRIAQCTTESILQCMMDAAAIGVRPGGTMGRGWLVPRQNRKRNPPVWELSYDPGWRGLSDVARRSGVVLRIESRIVHERDRFHEVLGTNPRLEHDPFRPEDDDDNPGQIIAAYAIAFFKEGDPQFEVVWRRDLEKIRAKSATEDKAGNPWHDWPDEMARKSAVRRLCKHLPTDEELEFALEVATRAESVDVDVDGVLTSLPESQPQPRRIAERIKGRRAAGDAATSADVAPATNDTHQGEPTDGEPPDDYESADGGREPGED